MVERCGADGLALVRQRNRFAPGEELELLSPDGREPERFICGELRDETGAPVTVANRAQQPLTLRLPRQVPPLSILRRRRAPEDVMVRRQQP